MTYAFHPMTTLYFTKNDITGLTFGCLLFVGLSGYSLFSQRCPESAIYRDNEQEFGFGSNHYQRPFFFVLLSIAMFVRELTEQMPFGSSTDLSWLYHMFLYFYFAQVIGLLSHPVVNMLWAME